MMIFYQIGDLLQSGGGQSFAPVNQELLSSSREMPMLLLMVKSSADVDGVLVGDIIVVKTGEIIPLDGTIQSGKII